MYHGGVCQDMAEAQIDAFRRGEYYGERRQYIPDDSEVIGQDLVNRQLLADEPAGLARDGFSSANDLALVDHREFASSEDFPDIFHRTSTQTCRTRFEQG